MTTIERRAAPKPIVATPPGGWTPKAARGST